MVDYGRIPLKLNSVKGYVNNDHETVLNALTSKGDVQLTTEFENKIKDVVTDTTYRRSSGIITSLSGMGFNKDIIWNIIKKMGITASETYSVDPSSYDLILIDGSGGKGKHSWYVFIGIDSESGEMYPLHHSVGLSLSNIKKELLSQKLLNKNHIIVADGERGIHSQFKGFKIQMCAFHFERHVGYTLWEEGMCLEGRKEINKKIRQILNTLKNSVMKNVGKK